DHLVHPLRRGVDEHLALLDRHRSCLSVAHLFPLLRSGTHPSALPAAASSGGRGRVGSHAALNRSTAAGTSRRKRAVGLRSPGASATCAPVRPCSTTITRSNASSGDRSVTISPRSIHGFSAAT